MQRVESEIYGTPDDGKNIIEELAAWCKSKGYEIRRGMQWNVVMTPDYVGADGQQKKGREDKHVTHQIRGGEVQSGQGI